MARKKSAEPSPEQAKEMIEFRDSGIHGMGGFARCKIKKDTPLIEYIGERITKAESARRLEEDNRYIFTLDDETDIDGKVDWNPARYLNHSCEPNAYVEIFGDQVWILALKSIKPGEEITYNYSYGFDEHEDHPCLCGSKKCVGYMVAEEFFPKVRRKKMRREKVAAV